MYMINFEILSSVVIRDQNCRPSSGDHYKSFSLYPSRLNSDRRISITHVHQSVTVDKGCQFTSRASTRFAMASPVSVRIRLYDYPTNSGPPSNFRPASRPNTISNAPKWILATSSKKSQGPGESNLEQFHEFYPIGHSILINDYVIIGKKPGWLGIILSLDFHRIEQLVGR